MTCVLCKIYEKIVRQHIVNFVGKKITTGLEDFLSLIEQFPKNTTSIIMGDFNLDLFKRLQSVVGKFEDIFLSQGLYPLISLATHKTNSSSSCIDNIFTNAIEKCCLSGIIDDIGLHHSPIFSIFDLNLSGTSGKQNLQIQEYSYSAKNIAALRKRPGFPAP